MTQIWPGCGEGPVPTTVSMICKPEGVVTGFPVVWACAIEGASEKDAPATPMARERASGIFRYWKRRMFSIPDTKPIEYGVLSALNNRARNRPCADRNRR